MTQSHIHKHRDFKRTLNGKTVLSTSLSDVLFYTAYTIWLVLMIANTSLFSRYLGGVYAGIRMFCLLLLFLKETVDMRATRTSLKGFIVAVAMIGCCLIAADTALVDGIVFIVCGRNKDSRTLIKLSVRVTLSVLVIVILSSLIGVVQNYSGWHGTRRRYFLGFRYALYPASFLFFSTCAIVYIKSNYLTFAKTFVIIACNTVIFYLTLSRTSFVLSLLVSLLAFALAASRRRHPKRAASRLNPHTAILCSSVFFIAALVSFTLVMLYTSSNQLMVALDHSDLLGGRLVISNNAISSNGIGLLGREMHFSGAALGADGLMPTHDTYDYVDNFYIKIALNYGLLFLVLFLALHTKLLWDACMQGDYYLIIVLIAIALHCMMDNAAVHLYYNPFLFLVGSLMKPRKSPTKALT